ncbi:MAG: metallophosphoesterase [Myxococcaceae bacterium]
MPMTRRQVLRGAAAGLVAATAARAEKVHNKAVHFEIEHVDVTLSGLDPAHDGLKVAQLSDIHIGIGTPDGRVIAALEAVEREKADVLVLTGDYITWKPDPVERVGQLIALRKKVPTFAVLGNHDHWTYPKDLRTQLEHADVTVLQNEHTVTRINGAPFTFFGIDDQHSGHQDVDATFKGSTAGGSSLVLAHTPVSIRSLPEDRGLFCLSGHTHGGSVYLPSITPRVFTIAGQPYVRGHYDVGGNRLYVNRGLGFGGILLGPRVASPPEVTILTLRRG